LIAVFTLDSAGFFAFSRRSTAFSKPPPLVGKEYEPLWDEVSGQWIRPVAETCLSLDSGDLVRVLFDRKKIPTPAEFTEDCRYELQIAPKPALGFS
jgi:hypothetical protein